MHKNINTYVFFMVWKKSNCLKIQCTSCNLFSLTSFNLIYYMLVFCLKYELLSSSIIQKWVILLLYLNWITGCNVRLEISEKKISFCETLRFDVWRVIDALIYLLKNFNCIIFYQIYYNSKNISDNFLNMLLNCSNWIIISKTIIKKQHIQKLPLSLDLYIFCLTTNNINKFIKNIHKFMIIIKIYL